MLHERFFLFPLYKYIEMSRLVTCKKSDQTQRLTLWSLSLLERLSARSEIRSAFEAEKTLEAAKDRFAFVSCQHLRHLRSSVFAKYFPLSPPLPPFSSSMTSWTATNSASRFKGNWQAARICKKVLFREIYKQSASVPFSFFFLFHFVDSNVSEREKIEF